MASEASVVWVSKASPAELAELMGRALSELGCKDVDVSPSRVTGRSSVSVLRNRWAADYDLEIASEGDLTVCSAVVRMAGGTKHGDVLVELAKRLPRGLVRTRTPIVAPASATRRIARAQGVASFGKLSLQPDALLDDGCRVVTLADHGVTVTVDSAGAIDQRITGTRLALTGVYALAFRKKKDNRELYLLVEADNGYNNLLKCDPKQGEQARAFAARVNSASRAARSGAHSPAPPTPTGDGQAVEAPDVVEQIRRVAELRDQGILTPEEFDAKKADLLARL